MTDKNKIIQCRSKANNLYLVFQRAANLEHAIKGEKEWLPFIPTHFIYSFFAFNALFNIDWGKSIISGHLEDNTRVDYFVINSRTKQTYRPSKSENEQIENYIRFCFQNNEFCNQYKEKFLGIILSSATSKEELSQKLNHIKRGFVTKEIENNFLKAKEDLLLRNVFNRYVILDIVKYIYKIRCNIFHGSKTTTDMIEENQQCRIQFYANVIVAICDMLFSYIDYLETQ